MYKNVQSRNVQDSWELWPDELRQHSFVRHLAVALLYLEHSSTEDRAREKFWKVSITVTLQHKCAITLTFEIFLCA
jgi:hypothetical protein